MTGGGGCGSSCALTGSSRCGWMRLTDYAVNYGRVEPAGELKGARFALGKNPEELADNQQAKAGAGGQGQRPPLPGLPGGRAAPEALERGVSCRSRIGRVDLRLTENLHAQHHVESPPVAPAATVWTVYAVLVSGAAREREEAIVPDLRGLSAFSARDVGHRVGLVVVGPDPDGPPLTEGNVIGQMPAAGIRVMRSSTLTVWIDRHGVDRPAPSERVVPDLVGQTL